MVAQLLARGSLVVASIILARRLETAEFAAYGYFQLTVAMLAAYAALGMGVAASRFFAEAKHGGARSTPPLGTLWVLSALAGAVLALMVACAPFDIVRGALDIPRWLLALGVFSAALGVVPGGAILGLEQYRQASVISLLSAAVLLGGAVLAAGEKSAVLAMIALVVSSLVQSVGSTVLVLLSVGWSRLVQSANFRRVDLTQVLSLSGPMFAVSLLAASGAWLVGRVILAGPMGERGFALYTIGLQWFALALFVPGMMSRVLLPLFVEARFNPSGIDARLLVRRGAKITLGAAASMAVIGYVASPWLAGLYGESYQAEGWIMVSFLFAAIPSAPANTIGNAIVAGNAQREWLLISLVSFCVLVFSAQVFAWQGALAGAWAHGISATSITILAFFVARTRGLL